MTRLSWMAMALGGLWVVGGLSFLMVAILRNPPESLMQMLGGSVFALLFMLPGVASSALVAWSASSAGQTRFVKEARWGAVVFSLVSLFLVWVTIIAGGYLFAPLALASVILALINIRSSGRHRRLELAENS